MKTLTVPKVKDIINNSNNKYREILEQYWNKNPSLRDKQKRIGGKLLRRAKKYTRKPKRKTSKKSNKRRNRVTRRYKKHKR
jgi:hypothetical protein